MAHTGVMTTRTDIHRPSAVEFDPENYTVLGFADFHPEDGHRPVQEISRLVGEGWSFSGAPHGSGQCSHCGARLRYAALMGHAATKTLLYVGETCLDNRFSLTAAEFQRMRKEATLNAERRSKAAQIEALLVQYPHLAYASYAHNIDMAGGVLEYTTAYAYGEFVADTQEEAEAWLATQPNHDNDYVIAGAKYGTTWGEKTRQGVSINTLSDIWDRVRRYGDISEKAAAHVDRVLGWLSDAEDKRAEREGAKAAQVEAGGVVTPGRQVVEGTVAKITWKTNDFGGAWKITVTLDNGAKVWGTLPSALETFEATDDIIGKRVRFNAEVEASTEDPTFGFYKRPTKPAYVTEEA